MLLRVRHVPETSHNYPNLLGSSSKTSPLDCDDFSCKEKLLKESQRVSFFEKVRRPPNGAGSGINSPHFKSNSSKLQC